MNINCVFRILFLFFISTSSFVAQNKSVDLKSIWENSKNADSTRFNAINTFYHSQSHIHPDSLFLLTDFHYDLAKKKKEFHEMAKALNEKAFVYYIKGDTKKSMVELKKVITIYEKLKDSVNLSTIYGNVGNIYGEERKYQEAVRYFNKTLEIYKKTGNEKEQARMYHNLGLIYFLLDNNTLATLSP
jgi:tetratricopeptide (TPR) repeat protein